MGSGHFTWTIDGEFLSITAAKFAELPLMILSLRLDSDSFDCTNIALRPEQAVRLWRDLCNMASNSDIMKEAIQNTPCHYEAYRNIMTDSRVSPEAM